MKTILYKTRFIWIILLALLVGSLSGCATTTDKWDWAAGSLYLARTGEGECIKLSENLYKQMTDDGEAPEMCSGRYKGERHRWIELDEKIYDPSQSDTDPKYYVKDTI